VRELQNLLERLAIQCGGRLVQVSDLPARYRPDDWQPTQDELAAEQGELALDEVSLRIAEAEAAVLQMAELADRLPLTPTLAEPVADASRLPDEGLDLRAHLDAIERRLIEQALQRSSGIVAHAARLLGLRRTTLVEKLRKFSLAVTEADASES
jgi:sigma-54 specific flagellar transcriptional regulator A